MSLKSHVTGVVQHLSKSETENVHILHKPLTVPVPLNKLQHMTKRPQVEKLSIMCSSQ